MNIIPNDTYEYWLRSNAALMGSLHELEGSYVSMYNQLYTVTHDRPNDHRLCSHGFVLMRVAREHGVNVLGVTSEHKSNGEYVVSVGGAPRVYLGKRNYFTSKAASKWSIVQ